MDESIVAFDQEEPKLRMTGRDTNGQRSETVRRANLSTIVRGLHLRGPMSRSELVVRTGLTRGGIRGLVGELTAAGLVTEERSSSPNRPGRPSPIARPRPERAAVLALDIAVDALGVALVGFGGEVITHVQADRARGHLAPERIVADLARLARPMFARRGTEVTVIGIGVAVVGLVRASDGMVRVAPNLGWRDVPLGDLIRGALALGVPVSVANEADLGAVAEHRRGAAIDVDDLLYLSGEVGVGAGVIIGGKPLAGSAGYAGEVGHIPLNPDGTVCRCGSVGCWETEVGERALLRRGGRRPNGGRAAIHELLGEVERSPRARAAVTETGRWLGRGLAGLVNTFNPSMIVLGGLFGRLHALVSTEIDDGLARYALREARETLQIVPAVLGSDAALLGAGELAFEPFLVDPAGWLAPRPALVTVAGA